ncbi:hypothetical protein KIN20_017778 [Parelaphostrongylus tenuis]|uniref:Uncharacterized protein n=1 Tax=Parelaphostrongylus tenuis TaxID=148309 RepID=A0AAD5QR12_PARTN|nr:hypothetical protein KIN20_017778 [Parelaphostrongylus tenuis]
MVTCHDSVTCNNIITYNNTVSYNNTTCHNTVAYETFIVSSDDDTSHQSTLILTYAYVRITICRDHTVMYIHRHVHE